MTELMEQVAEAPGEMLEAPPAAAVPVPDAGLSGIQKAATLLVTLGSDRAAGIFKHLREHEIEMLSLEMAKMHSVSPANAEAVYGEVLETVRVAGYFAEGGVQYAREVLEASVGKERAEEIIQR